MEGEGFDPVVDRLLFLLEKEMDGGCALSTFVVHRNHYHEAFMPE